MTLIAALLAPRSKGVEGLLLRARSANLAREGRFGYLLVESTGASWTKTEACRRGKICPVPGLYVGIKSQNGKDCD